MNDIEKTIKHYGTGYYRATFLFPPLVREAIWTLYQFVRLPDEIVDGPHPDEEALNAWENEWKNFIENKGQTNREIFLSFKKVLEKHSIPKEYTYQFFDAMRQDLHKNRYGSYRELEDYMKGSASVVGFMISCIIGYRDNALFHAQKLAEAFQMTNFLRDIKSDYDERGRIYIPREDMDRFKVSEEHIAKGILDQSWRNLMQFEILRTRELYNEGVRGIPLLDKRGQKAVYASALIYKEILDDIESREYDVFSERVVVSPFRKTMLLFKALCYRNR